MDESDTGPHVVAFEGATYVIVPTTHVADEGDAVAPTVVVLVDISGGCPCCLNFVDCRCCCEHRCCSTFRPRCCGSGHDDDMADGLYVLVTLVGGYDSGIRQCPVHSDVGLPRYPDCRLVHLVCSSLSAAVTGSMKAVPKAVLSASLFRLLSFLAKRVTPVVLMTYRHNVSWVDFVVRRTVLVQTTRFNPPGGTRSLVKDVSFPVASIKPRILPFDMDLLRWVVDSIVNMVCCAHSRRPACRVGRCG